MARPRLPVGGHGTVRLQEVQDGLWRARTRVRDTDGRVRQVEAYGRSQKSAERGLARRLARRDAPTAISTQTDAVRPAEGHTDNHPLSWWIDDYLSHARVRPQTVEAYRRSLVALPARLAAMSPETITPLDVASISIGHRPANERQTAIVVRAALDRAVLARVIDSNPARAVPPHTRRTPRPVRALTGQEEAALLALIDTWAEERGKHGGDTHKLRDVVVVGIALGTRIGETLALTADDIEPLEGGRVRVSVAATVVEARGGAVRQPMPKTASGNRALVVGGDAAVVLRERAEKARKRPASPAYLLPSRAGGVSTPSNVRRALRTVVSGTDLEWVTPQSLRRTRGTRIAQTRGVLTAAEALGHANTRTISRYVQQRREVDLTDE